MQLPFISLSKEELSNFEEAVQKEWLVTNGLGGYASSTVLDMNTRKYHGLLVAALCPPRDRRVFLAKLDEELCTNGNCYQLGTNEFQGGISPKGYNFLKEFSVSPFPKYVYALQNIEIHKRIFMPHHKNAIITIYSISNRSSFDMKFRVFPLITGRPFHSITDRLKAPVEFDQRQENNEVEIGFRHPQSTLAIRETSGSFSTTQKWVEHIFYREEANRGESCFDDYYQPGCFETDVKACTNEGSVLIAVADENRDAANRILAEMPSTLHDAETLFEKEMKRCENLLTTFRDLHPSIDGTDWLNWLIVAADRFIVQSISEEQASVIAGYHWFGVWGRDTFVSLPGLMLLAGRFEDARKTFLGFKEHYKQGLIPNFLPDQTGRAAYNTVDATLWYVNATLQYLKYTGDFKFVEEQLWDTLKAIIENHVKGTLFNIHMDSDGLLTHGPQLTWVDASVDGRPVNPRAGKAVEVQALWYNALKTMELLGNRYEEKSEAEKYTRMAERTKESFVEKFWNAKRNCLFDVVSDYECDCSLRPNQIFAAALDFAMLDDAKNEGIVDIVQNELLTPCGLRSLARSDTGYVGVYAGDRRSRDKAYHNGTVWPWLLGPFTTAYLKTKSSTESRREYALKNFLTPLFLRMGYEGGLGNLNEIFDGDPPHKPRGCIAQAWSIAEPLRAYIEDVMQAKPRFEKEVLKG